MPPKRLKSKGDSTSAGSSDKNSFVPEPLDSEHVYTGIAVAGVSAAIYFATIHPSVPGGDSGELITVAYELGVAHPPGYPLFILLAKLAMILIPFGSIAFRVNALNVLFASAACGFLATTVSRLSKSPACGVLASMGYGFSHLVWTYSVTSEVFAMNNFFACLLVFLCVEYHYTRSRNIAFLGSLCCGLALTNQHTIVLFILPFCLWIAAVGWRDLVNTPTVLRLAEFGALGMSPYLFLWFSSTFLKTPNSWGDCSTLDGLIGHMLRRDYGTFSLASKHAHTQANFTQAFEGYFRDLKNQISILGIVLSVIGILITLMSARKNPLDVRVMLFVSLSFYLIFFHSLANLPIDNPLLYGVTQRFWMQPNALVCLFAGLGMSKIQDFLSSRFSGGSTSTNKASSGENSNPAPQPSQPSFFSKMSPVQWGILAVCIALAFTQVSIHYEARDESKNYATRDFGRMVLDPLPQNAILLTRGDLVVNSARYVQTCEGFRPDVTIIDQEMLTFRWYVPTLRANYPHVEFPGTHYHVSEEGSFTMKQFIEANDWPNVPIFFCFGFKDGDFSVVNDYALQPWGAPERLVRKRDDVDIDSYVLATNNVIPPVSNFSLPDMNQYGIETWERVVFTDYFETIHKRAHYLLMYALHRERDHGSNVQKALKKSEEIMLWLLENHPQPPAHYLKNTAILYNRMMQAVPSDETMKKTLKYFRDFSETPEGKKDKDSKAIQEGIANIENYLRARGAL